MAGEIIDTPARERPLLLLVEDDAGVRRSLQLLFRARGFDVRAYAMGNALLADPLARDACCFVADYRLEEIDGIEVLSRLRDSGWSGPAVLITAFPSADLSARALAHGFSQVLEKPFREHALGDAVARLTGA
ncbi:response regulator [Sphingobium sp. D43FB]|uniref:response regulator transcription factor n=1 Tax=Sphingobium sp. D43FB TaxID=2017595 RepID=UPI000BB54F04|nr:response regulator [Sphingobium sp. D43FB]PBN42927.1 response regulator [Sphingobium sp. D43FB]